MPWSIHQREALLQRLRTDIFDLVVVGGGITGAGVARDAALRGLKVALIERGDFASGTSSRSSKLIHGGLRYLEMGDIGLVFEAVRERQRLLELAPHLARAQSFVLPVFEHSRRSVFVLDVGLTIYDMLAAFAGVMAHRAVRKRALLRLEPLLKSGGLSGGVRYYDAMTDDSRLVLANVRGALEAGAVPLSRVAFVEPVFKNHKLISCRVRDEWTGQAHLVATKCIVSAAGPWTDDMMGKWKGQDAASTLKPSKGVHVVVPRARLPLSQAVMMTATDGRVVFALPWAQATVLGTTDTAYSGPLDEPETTWDDASYLVETANLHFDVQGGPLAVDDVVSTWAGIRPLVANEPGQSSYKTSREHTIATDPRGLVTVAGGKLTTYRVMAAEAVDAALKLLPPQIVAECKPCVTARLPLPGAEKMPRKARSLDALIQLLMAQEGLDLEDARHFACQYGSDAGDVIAYCRATPTDPGMTRPSPGVEPPSQATRQPGFERILPDLPLRWGELDWMVREEMALTLVDVAVRRSHLYYVAGERLLPIVDALAARLAAACGYPAERQRAQADEIRAYIADHRVAPREASHAA